MVFSHSISVVAEEEEEKEPVVDFSCLENIKTMLYSLDNTMYYSYTRVPWTLFIRKEVKASIWLLHIIVRNISR